MLQVKNLVKVYKSKKAESVTALNNVSIDFPETGFVFLLGKSGSGKSTLLNSIGGLDKFDSGEIIIKGKSSKDFTQADFDSYRNTFIGFIFQEYNILENFSVAKNLALALELQGKKADHEEVMRLLRQVEMEQYAKRKPNELSGGQKQRVAIARALIKNPEIIMADEPTGALDSNTGKQVMDTLKELSKTKLVIVVSHDREFAEIYGDRIIELKDGKILSDVTKKEIEAQEASDGIKIIDNSVLYIKKGKQISEGEMKAIAKIINANTEKGDTFISLDPAANEKLKEGAKINDDGNKEKFTETEKEDIKVKSYNPNSLKLIKSRLKFSDSFKMGASALKNKVGKLIFTIILSFFAFTVFGVVDALGQWNRADSVYQAMTMQNEKNIAFRKTVNEGTYAYDQALPAGDLAILQNKFPNHVIKGVAESNYSDEITLNGISWSRSNNPLWDVQVSGYLSITKTELDKLGFELIGRLPANDNEVAISKHLYDSMVKRTEEATDDSKKIKADFMTNYNPDGATPLMVSMPGLTQGSSGYDIKIVGLVNDKTNLQKYKDMSDEDILKLSDKMIDLDQVLDYGWTRLCYSTPARYNTILENSYVDIHYYLKCGESSTGISKGSMSDFLDQDDFESYAWQFYQERQCTKYDYDLEEWVVDTENPNYVEYTREDFYEDKQILAVKTGKDIFNLAKDEIIVSEYLLKESVANYQTAIDAGLTVKLSSDWDGKDVIREFKVVGVHEYNYYVSPELAEELKPLFAGYSFAVSALTGNAELDEAFVNRLETFDDNGIKYRIQNSSTPMLNMLEEILLMMTGVFVWVALGFAVFASLMLMNFISTSISYKKREIGVLRALGARGSDVFGIFFNESMIIAAINFVLSTIATFVVCIVLNNIVLASLPVDIVLLNVGIRQLILIAGVSVLSAFLGSFLPTSKISRKRPIDAINNR